MVGEGYTASFIINNRDINLTAFHLLLLFVVRPNIE